MNKAMTATMEDVKSVILTPDIQQQALAKVITSDDFSDRIAQMAKEFDAMKQDMEESESGPRFIPMKVKMALLRKYFGPFELQIDFNHLPDMRTGHIVQATVMVLTEAGMMKWFSRYGMAAADSNESSQGVEVDAETSAKRRVLAALGLGGDYHEEVAEGSQISLLRDVQDAMDKGNLTVKSVLAGMSAKAKGSILVGDYDKMPSSDKTRSDASTFDSADLVAIRDYLTKK